MLYIYKPSLDNYTNFKSNITLCAICKKGYNIQGNYCSRISNCSNNSNIFGGCNSCNDGYQINISEDICYESIPNCKVLYNNGSTSYCLECNNNYYGILFTNNSISGNNGIYQILSFYGSKLKYNYIDSNNIKIPYYKWFYFQDNNLIKFNECTNARLNRSNGSFNGGSSRTLTDWEQSYVLATRRNYNYAFLCRKGFTMINNSGFFCSNRVIGSQINVPYNNFLNQSISRRCQRSDSHLLILRRIAGPFCYTPFTSNFYFGYNIAFNLGTISNCFVHVATANRNFAPDRNSLRCLFCNDNYFINSNGYCDWFVNASTSIVLYCTNNTNGRCNSCPTGMSIVNDSCVNSNQLLWTNGLSISTFINNNNCVRITWNQNIAGYRRNFALNVNNTSNLVNCLECNEDYIMNYETFSCVRKNLFNFSDCLQSQNGIGCLACINGKFSFGSDYNHEICINSPNNDSFLNNYKDTNCILFDYNKNNFKLNCHTCKIGYSIINNICIKNIDNCRIMRAANQCLNCNDNYFLNSSGYCSIGMINNCLSYNSKNICSQCENGYIKWGNSNNIVCISNNIIKSFNNCQEILSETNSFNLYCLNNIRIPLKPNSLNNSICIPNYINNCLIYDPNNLNICTQCISNKLSNGTYINNEFIFDINVCRKRNIYEIIKNCKIYKNNLAICLECEEGFYIDKNNKCKQNPVGSVNCKYYIPNQPCQLCQINYFLNNNLCTPIASNNIISNCYKYDNNQKCNICNRGYLINNNNCDLLSNNTFLDNNLCVFDKLNGYVNNKCQCKGKNYYFNNITKRCESLLNCIEIDNVGNCIQCNYNKMYDSLLKKCIEIKNKIQDCMYYSNNGKCNKCFSYYALINNKCLRVSIKETVNYCDNYVNEKKCLLCQQGNYNYKGKCEILNNNILYSLYDNKDIPLICKTNSYMNINRKCILNKNNDNDNNSNISTIFISLFKCIILLTYFHLN